MYVRELIILSITSFRILTEIPSKPTTVSSLSLFIITRTSDSLMFSLNLLLNDIGVMFSSSLNVNPSILQARLLPIFIKELLNIF